MLSLYVCTKIYPKWTPYCRTALENCKSVVTAFPAAPCIFPLLSLLVAFYPYKLTRWLSALLYICIYVCTVKQYIANENGTSHCLCCLLVRRVAAAVADCSSAQRCVKRLLLHFGVNISVVPSRNPFETLRVCSPIFYVFIYFSFFLFGF